MSGAGGGGGREAGVSQGRGRQQEPGEGPVLGPRGCCCWLWRCPSWALPSWADRGLSRRPGSPVHSPGTHCPCLYRGQLRLRAAALPPRAEGRIQPAGGWASPGRGCVRTAGGDRATVHTAGRAGREAALRPPQPGCDWPTDSPSGPDVRVGVTAPSPVAAQPARPPLLRPCVPAELACQAARGRPF